MLGASVTPGQQLSVVVGSAGGRSSTGSVCFANGGMSADFTGGNGGSGGTAASSWDTGGRDGGDGPSSEYFLGGKGQHTTTRYFGESNGTLYANGGDGWTDANADPNTGNGSHQYPFSLGGSSICIIRWGDQKS